MAEYILKKEGLYTVFEANGTPVIRILSFQGAEDSFTEIETGIWRWTRKTDKPVSSMRMEFDFAQIANFTMVPAVSYNGNGWGTTPEYIGGTCDGTPWTWASHRVTIPSCTYTEGFEWAAALMGEPNDNSACSLWDNDGHMRHALIFPEEEGPKTLQRHFWSGPFKGTMEPKDRFDAIITVFPVTMPKLQYRTLMDFAWRYYAHPIKPGKSPEELYKLSIAYMRYLYQEEKSGFCGFTLGAQWHKSHHMYLKTVSRYEVSWNGQSAGMANTMLWDYLRTGNRDSLNMGLAAHDSWIKYARFPAGHVAARVDYDDWRTKVYPPDYEPDIWSMGECTYESHKSFNKLKFRRNSEGIIQIQNDAENLGGAADQYFIAYDLANECGVSRTVYLETALGICDFAIKRQTEDGQFAKSWDDNGELLTREGTVGCFLIRPLITAYRRTGNKKYLDSAIKAFDFYYEALLKDGFTTAGALDTYCIDKQSAGPLLRAALVFFDTTDDKAKYKKAAEDIGWYICTWIMHFTVNYPPDSLIGKMGYDTFGSTSVSTAHNALDQYALRDILSFLRLADITGSVQWKEKAIALWCNATQCISDGTMFVNGRLRPAGSQDEAIFHTRWGRYGVPPFSPSQWLPGWPCYFRMENLRLCSNWDIFRNGLEAVEGKITK